MKVEKNKKIVMGICVVMVSLLIGFLIGSKYTSSKSSQNFANIQRQGRNLSGGGGLNNRFQNSGGFNVGEVIKKDDNSLVIKLRDGGSKIILLSEKTQVVKSVEGGMDDVIIGQNVVVSGRGNSDGSVSVDSIQVR